MADGARRWELHDGTQQAGPLDEGEVVRMIDAGLPAGTMVRPEGAENWKGLRVHAPFAMALERREEASPGAAAIPPGPTPSAEKVFLQEEDVTITSARAVIRGTTYALTNITSVRRYVEPRDARWLVLAAIIGVFGLVMLGVELSVGVASLLIAGLIALGFFFGLQDTHWVRIGTAGAEMNAISYVKQAEAQRVVDALNEAIVHRG